VAKKINNWSLRFLFQRTKFPLTRERNLSIYRFLTIVQPFGCQKKDSLKGPIMIRVPPDLVKSRQKIFSRAEASPIVDRIPHIFQAISDAG
jgi:hypothetical protein